jgi:cyclohexa-1,5-dienecarbonyl-CoA hydratase
MIAAFSELFSALGASELPIIAVVDGAALGAGFELAMMADIILASERATFGQPEIRLGFFAPVGVAWLPRRIGVGRAIEVTTTGRTFSAVEMRELGLVSRVVPTDDLQIALDAVLADLRRASAAVIRMNVRLTRQLAALPYEQARLAAERVFVDDLLRLEDVSEGIAAFFEKRRPEWRNR